MTATAMPPSVPSSDLRHRVGAALERAVNALLAKQRPGPASAPGVHWCAELEGDSILSSEYLLMKVILGQEQDERDRARLLRIANHLRLVQRPDGSWGQYPGSPLDISACVKAYFALKLFGDHPDAPHMRAAREVIRANGGAEACNTFSTFYLACLAQVTWDACPAIPPEIVLLPEWSPFHLRKVSAWTRTMILPLAICSALRPVRKLPAELGIDELFLDLAARTRLNKAWDRSAPLSWTNAFLFADQALKLAQGAGVTPMRERALREAEQWLLARLDTRTTEGLGAIFPPMVYIQVAFKALGYARSHPVIQAAEANLDAFLVDAPHPDPTRDHVRIQPCFSPVWDTAIALDALAQAGRTSARDPAVAAACDWLRAREVTLHADWAENLRAEDRALRPGIDTAMWAFEYRNDWYPDVDDTCMVAKAFARCGDRDGESASLDASRRAVRWIFAMQNDDGGWAAFDRTRDRPWLEAIPFADHNAMQDPSCPDITGRVVDALAACGVSPKDPRIAAAARYILQHQRPAGWWYGRWGVNGIYGTWQAVNGLVAAGTERSHPALRKALAWLRAVQNPDGGFGESANAYLDDALVGRGRSTASQTAWGLMTLLNLAGPEDDAARRAAAWLCDHQLAHDKRPYEPARTVSGVPDPGSDEHAYEDHVSDIAGSWSEHDYTGTGFPRVFYLRYHLYRHSFPVMALARFVRASNPG